MTVVESYAAAVMMCVITMFCWGSWANTQKLASKEWRFELFYWDYAIGVLLFALVLAFTLGSTGSVGRSFLADMAQAETGSLVSGFVGGVVFNLSHITLLAPLQHSPGGRHRHCRHGRRLSDRRRPRARPWGDHQLHGQSGRQPGAAVPRR